MDQGQYSPKVQRIKNVANLFLPLSPLQYAN